MIVVSRLYKLCSRCRTYKRASTDPKRSEFSRRRAGSAQLRAVCKQCDLERRHEYDKRNPDVKRRRQREWLDKKRQDPERHAILRDQSREHWRRKHGVTPDRYRIGRPAAAAGGRVLDAAPFVAWLRTLGGDPVEIANICRLNNDQVSKWLRGERTTVRADTVDRALIFANTLMTFDDIYPLEEAA